MSARLDHALAAYVADERPALCPRCGGWDGPILPFCTDQGWTHLGTCSKYTFADELCADCDLAARNPDPASAEGEVG